MKNKFHFRLPELVLAVLICVSGVFLSISAGGFIVNFNKVGFTVFSSMQKGVHFVSGGVSSFFVSMHDFIGLKKEYAQLKEKLKDYEYLQRSNTEIRKENERLREQLGFSKNIQYKNIAAQIIGRDPDSLYSGITINKGARSGIKNGMPVVAIQNGNIGVVGKIVTVGLGTSLIMPVYDLQCNISARVQTSRDLGIIKGQGFLEKPLSLGYIRKTSSMEFQEGDIVVTSGENGNYTRNIPIGRISKIAVLDYDANLEIEVEPIIDFSRLETVLIIDKDTVNVEK